MYSYTRNGLDILVVNLPDLFPMEKPSDGEDTGDGDGIDDEVGDHHDDDDQGGVSVGDRTTTSASSPSKYARQPILNAKPVTKSQVTTG